MLKIATDKLLFGSILLHYLYILLLNTSSLHGFTPPDKTIWTGVLLVFVLVLSYRTLKDPAKDRYEQLLYFAIVLGIGGSLLRTIGFSISNIVYAMYMIVISILTFLSLIKYGDTKIRILIAIYLFAVIVLILRIFKLNEFLLTFSLLVEVWIVIGIIYFNYKVGYRWDELFIAIILTIIGFELGNWITSLTSDVPALIIGTIFEQTLSVGQFNYSEVFNPQFFLALHVAEVFNIMFLLVYTKRSLIVSSIIFAGLDMTYPPLMVFRAVALLLLIRVLNKVDQDTEENFEETKDTHMNEEDT